MFKIVCFLYNVKYTTVINMTRDYPIDFVFGKSEWTTDESYKLGVVVRVDEKYKDKKNFWKHCYKSLLLAIKTNWKFKI